MTASEETKLREKLIEFILSSNRLYDKEKLEGCSTIELITIKIELEIKDLKKKENE